MATLIKTFIKATDIPKAKMIKTKDGLGFTMMSLIADEVDKYGNNVSSWMDQTKDERDAKANRTYIGNGNAIWSDGKVTVVNKDNPQGTVVGSEVSAPVVAKSTPPEEAVVEEDGDLPF